MNGQSNIIYLTYHCQVFCVNFSLIPPFRWNNGIMECWINGILEYWIIGQGSPLQGGQGGVNWVLGPRLRPLGYGGQSWVLGLLDYWTGIPPSGGPGGCKLGPGSSVLGLLYYWIKK